MKNDIKLSNRELDVMNVFWEAEKSFTAKEIAEWNPELKLNTVRVVLKGLLKKGFIETADIVYSNTVLTQSYRAVLKAEDYMAYQMTHAVHGKVLKEQIFAALLKQEKNEEALLSRLEDMVKERRKELNKKKKP